MAVHIHQLKLMRNTQLPLGLELDLEAGFNNFYVSKSNHLTVNTLQQLPNTEQAHFIFLHGPPHSGRSHLLQATCHAALSSGMRAAYLPMRQLIKYSPTVILQSLENNGLVILDDIDHVFGEQQWEQGLFHFYNHLRGRTKLVVSARTTPANSGCLMPDLRTRLGAGLIHPLYPLSHEDLPAAIKLQASYRGLQLSKRHIFTLLNHHRRDMRTLMYRLKMIEKVGEKV